MLFFASRLLAQQGPYTFRAWELISYSGTIGVQGFYREQERILNDVLDFSKFPFVYGKLALDTRSYIGHPNLLLLDIGGEYNPGTSQQFYTVSPDRSEVLTFSRLNINGTIFNGKPMSLSGGFNIGRNFINREYVTSMRTDTRQWNVGYSFQNRILPLTINYTDRKWNQLEIETGRTYINDQKELQARVSKSFTKLGDTNEFIFNRFSLFREEPNLAAIDNINIKFILNNNFYFDKHRRYMFRSSINTLEQTGIITQTRLQMFENVHLRLPYKINFSGSYDLIGVTQPNQGYTQQRFNGTLDHELFSSLRTSVFYDYITNSHTAFKETNTRTGISFNYIKKIPANGTLNLAYSYRLHNQNVLSNPNSTVQIIDEPHVLLDGEVVLLDRPYVDLATVVVKDITGSIIYQRDFDYLLIERDQFVEIVRVPGGQLPNNTPVLVDYVAVQVGSYNFDSDLQSFTARVILFKQLLELYYTNTTQDYSGIEGSELLTLNYYTRHVYGVRMQVGLLNFGVERDEYNSTIVPYEKMRYFLRINGMAGKKVRLSLNGDLSDLTLTETNTDQLYSSIYGKAAYQIKPRMKLNLDIGYRKQIGEEIDLDLITSKLEYNAAFRNIYMKVGLEVYKRNFVGEQFNFRGVYFQLERRF